MSYIGIVCMLVFIITRLVNVKKILKQNLELQEVDKDFINQVNDRRG